MLTRKNLCAALDAKPNATAEQPFGPEVVVYKIGGKVFAMVSTEGEVRITLKIDPVLSETMREKYAAIEPGYHTNKRHWVTIKQDKDLPDAEIHGLIDHAYELVLSKLTKAARAALEATPAPKAKKKR
jgi:predicted DNA-binding protein (MmcQ/YjbR family)